MGHRELELGKDQAHMRRPDLERKQELEYSMIEGLVRTTLLEEGLT